MGDKYVVFDQRYQQVKFQYNSNGDINFAKVENIDDAVREIEKIQTEVSKATQEGVLDEERSIDVESKLKKAVVKAKKPKKDPKHILGYLEDAKNLLNGIDAVSGLMDGISEAIETIGNLFNV